MESKEEAKPLPKKEQQAQPPKPPSPPPFRTVNEG